MESVFYAMELAFTSIFALELLVNLCVALTTATPSMPEATQGCERGRETVGRPKHAGGRGGETKKHTGEQERRLGSVVGSWD